MRRPYIVNCIGCKGTATVKQTGATAELIQLGLDEQTGAPCYVIRADGSWPFAVWPDELSGVTWTKQAKA